MSTLRGAAGGLLLALAVGCGPQTPTVSGTVAFDGKPLPSGTVLFHGGDGRVEYSLITEGGRYSIANAPPGLVRITVRSHPAIPAGMPSSGQPPPGIPAASSTPAKEKRDGSHVAIPTRYLDPEKSGLRYTVRPGRQTHDIDLRP
jgi:hypothetical protein